jgi:RNA polymerase primary sigma factor
MTREDAGVHLGVAQVIGSYDVMDARSDGKAVEYFSEQIAANEPSPEAEAELSERRRIVRRALWALSPRERLVLILRYWHPYLIIGCDAATTLDRLPLKDIGIVFGRTRERIRQIEKQALRKLREALEGRI